MTTDDGRWDWLHVRTSAGFTFQRLTTNPPGGHADDGAVGRDVAHYGCPGPAAPLHGDLMVDEGRHHDLAKELAQQIQTL
jgi:hypothetical protein